MRATNIKLHVKLNEPVYMDVLLSGGLIILYILHIFIYKIMLVWQSVQIEKHARSAWIRFSCGMKFVPDNHFFSGMNYEWLFCL